VAGNTRGATAGHCFSGGPHQNPSFFFRRRVAVGKLERLARSDDPGIAHAAAATLKRCRKRLAGAGRTTGD
jgi:hypothetical protein